MLKQRIITALILLPLMLGMLFYASDALWALFAGLIALLALWEYGRMCGFTSAQNHRYLAFTALFGVVAYAGGWQAEYIFFVYSSLFWDQI